MSLVSTQQNRVPFDPSVPRNVQGPGGAYPMQPNMVTTHSDKFHWEDFLGPPNNGLNKPEPLDARTHSIDDMPDAYRGKNKFLEQKIRRLEIMQDDFTSILSPSEEVDDISFVWSEIKFNAHTADITPYQSAPRLVTYGEKQFRAILPRRGIGMRMEHNFMLTEKGRMIFYQSLVSMAQAVANVIQLEVMRAIRMTHDYPPEGYNGAGEFSGPNALDNSSIDALMQDSVANWYSMMNEGMLVQLIVKARSDIARRKGTAPDSIIAPEVFQQVLMHYDIERTTYKGAGATGIARSETDPTLLNRFMNMTIYTSKTYLNEDGHDLDFMRMTSEIGEYYVENSRRIADPNQPYLSSDTHFQIYDENRNRWYTIDPSLVLAHCGVWDDAGMVMRMGDPKLNPDWAQKHTFSERDFTNMALYYSMRSPQFEPGTEPKAGPHGHTEPHAEYDEWVTSELERNHRVFPVTHIGQINERHLGANDLTHAAVAIGSKLGNLDILRKIQGTVDMLSNQPQGYKEFWFGLNVTPQVAKARSGIINRTILMSPDGKFPALIARRDTFSSTPVGFGTYEGFQAIANAPVAILTTWGIDKNEYMEMINGFQQIVNNLRSILGSNHPLVDSAYARISTPTPSSYTVVWDALFGSNLTTLFGGVKRTAGLEYVENNGTQWFKEFVANIAAVDTDKSAEQLVETFLPDADPASSLDAILMISTTLAGVAIFTGRYKTSKAKPWNADTIAEYIKKVESVRISRPFKTLKSDLTEAIRNAATTGTGIDVIATSAASLAAMWVTNETLFATPELREKKAHLIEDVRGVITEYATAFIAYGKNIPDVGPNADYHASCLVVGQSVARTLFNEMHNWTLGDVPIAFVPADPEMPEVAVSATRIQDLYLSGFQEDVSGSNELTIIGNYWIRVYEAAKKRASEGDRESELVLQYIGNNAPVMRFLTTNPSFASRYYNTLAVSNPGDRLLMLSYLLAPLNKHTMQRFVSNNIPLPFRWMVARPSMSYDTYSITFMKAGKETMFTARRPGLFEFADTINTQTTQANYIACYGPIIKNPENIRHVNNVWPAGYNGGTGVNPYDPAFYSQGGRNYTDIYGNPNGGSIFIILLSCTEADSLPNPIALSGYFAMYSEMVDDTTIPENCHGCHYTMAPFYRMLVGFGVKGFDQYRKDSYRSLETRNNVPNDIMYAGYQQTFNRKTNDFTIISEGTGHFGSGMTYIGCHMIRNGRVSRHTMPRKL